ncbi:energy-coupling factor transport system permease protein [Mumia flava]|uniref:Energy-coupling factor transport system permease protein n=1 Tax=Mumia flava TaxID=1348852 RepID=A0A0B2BTI6_9ACTN|nr:energy-coupling factor transporter transmembrane component T [Mumia flava]PJJ57984.1 energy-coupling factor transport system permease protein [Mumia flava]
MRAVVREANPLALLAAGSLAIVASLAVRDLATGLVTLGAYAVVGAFCVPSLRFALVRFLAVAVASASVTWSTWLLGGHDLEVALTAGLRIVVLALPGAVLAAFLDPPRLADELGQRLRVPPRFAVAFAAALQRFALLRETWIQLDRARRARGFGPTANPLSSARHGAALAFALLVSALRDAGRMATAMDARGFATAHERTWAEPVRWMRGDTVLLGLGVALAVLPYALRLGGY